MKQYVVGIPGQTIIDLAIEKTGSFEGIKNFFENNNNVLDSQNLEGVTIAYEKQIIDQSIVTYFADRSKQIVTR